MSDQDKGIGPMPWSLADVSKLLDEQLGRSSQEDALETCQALLRIIWSRLQPTLGSTTMMAIMQRAMGLAKEHYPHVAYLQVTGNGINLDELRQHTEATEREPVQDMLKQCLMHVFEILVALTGDILVRQLLLEVERREIT